MASLESSEHPDYAGQRLPLAAPIPNTTAFVRASARYKTETQDGVERRAKTIFEMPIHQPGDPTERGQAAYMQLAEMVDGMLESAEEVYHSIQQAQYRPHVLDDYTVGRVREVHGTQLNDLWLYEEQLSRWQDATPTPAQSTEIIRLQGQLDRLRSVLTSCLALTDELKGATIEKVLSKSDVEVAIDFLSGKLKL